MPVLVPVLVTCRSRDLTRTGQSPLTVWEEILVLLEGTGSSEWSTHCCLPVTGTCRQDKKTGEKRKRQGVNKNRNRLNALTGKILKESGPSMSRNVSFKIEPLTTPTSFGAFGFHCIKALTKGGSPAEAGNEGKSRREMDLPFLPFMQTVLEAVCWLPRKRLGCETPENVLSGGRRCNC